MPEQANGRRSSSPGSPGISGAIKDAISAVASAVAPKSVTQIKARNDAAEDDAGIGRMKQAQSTDRDNSYSY